jgi:hypothetical protein
MLDECDLDSAESEINLIRILLARLMESAYRSPRLPLETLGAILAAVASAARTLASLVRFQLKFDAWASRSVLFQAAAALADAPL